MIFKNESEQFTGERSALKNVLNSLKLVDIKLKRAHIPTF